MYAAPSINTPSYHPGSGVEEVLNKVGQELAKESEALAKIRTSIERCEKLPFIDSQKLLNLPTRIGKVLE